MMKKKTIAYTDTEEQYNELKELAEHNSMSVSQLVRVIVNEHAAEVSNKPARAVILTKSLINIQKKKTEIPEDVYHDIVDMVNQLQKLN